MSSNLEPTQPAPLPGYGPAQTGPANVPPDDEDPNDVGNVGPEGEVSEGESVPSWRDNPSRYVVSGLLILFAIIGVIIAFILIVGGNNVGSNTLSPPPNMPVVYALANPVPGQQFPVQGTGFQPNESVEIFASNSITASVSDFIPLGIATAGPDGTFNKGDNVLPPERITTNTVYLLGRGSVYGFTSPVAAQIAGDQPPPPAEVTPTPGVPVSETATPGNTSQPDLIIGNVLIQLQPGIDCAQSSTLGLLIEVKNAGPVAAQIFVVNVNGTDFTVNTGLQPNQTFVFWVPGYAQGENRIVVDSVNNVTESNEENNSVFLTLPVPTLPPTCPTATTPPNTNLPDLTLGNISISLQPGVDCRVSAQLGLLIEIRNIGPAAAGSFNISVNGTIGTINGLPPNQSTQVWVAGYANGPNTIVIDPNNQIQELNRANNTASVTLPVPTLPANCRPTATATNTPDPNATGIWFGSFYANRDLDDPVVYQNNYPALNINWRNAAPGPGVPNSNWSAVFLRNENFPTNDNYEFTISADNGVRVYIDGTPVFNEWFVTGYRTKVFSASISRGVHQIRVEYFHATGQAALALSWKVGYTAWVGRYYNSNNFSGPVVLKRDDLCNTTSPCDPYAIDFNWGFGSPDPSITPDNFSIAWERTINLPAGTYRFYADVDDGIRAIVDGQTIFDNLGPGAKDGLVKDVTIGNGNHFFQVQYTEFTGQARIRFRWEPVIPPTPTPTNTSPATNTPTPTNTLPPVPPTNTPTNPPPPPDTATPTIPAPPPDTATPTVPAPPPDTATPTVPAPPPDTATPTVPAPPSDTPPPGPPSDTPAPTDTPISIIITGP